MSPTGFLLPEFRLQVPRRTELLYAHCLEEQRRRAAGAAFRRPAESIALLTPLGPREVPLLSVNSDSEFILRLLESPFLLGHYPILRDVFNFLWLLNPYWRVPRHPRWLVGDAVLGLIPQPRLRSCLAFGVVAGLHRSQLERWVKICDLTKAEDAISLWIERNSRLYHG